MKTKNKITIILLSLLILRTGEYLYAQEGYIGLVPHPTVQTAEFTQHEILLGGQIGFSKFLYNSGPGIKNGNLGGGAEIGYIYFLNSRMGIRTGVGLNIYQSDFKLNDLSDRYDTHYGNDDIEYRYDVRRYLETHKAMYLDIPIKFHFQDIFKTGLDDYKFYVSGGFKIGIPIRGQYYSHGMNFKSTGYFSNLNAELESPSFMGFGTFYNNEGPKKTIDLNMSYMFSLEAGVKWRLLDYISIYAGIYFDCGMNDIIKGNVNKRLVEYNSEKFPVELLTNSALVSQYTSSNGRTESIIKGNIIPMIFGFKVSVAFDVKDIYYRIE